jgi:ABC-type antimicrobial peptide transport system permease subunit
MTWALREAWTLVRARRSRVLLAGLGIFGAALVLGVAATVVQGLRSGFERAAVRADLPQVVARFDERSPQELRRALRALPNLDQAVLRYEETDVPLAFGDRRLRRGVVQLVGEGERRGYAIVAGRDLDPADGEEAVVERGLADAWGIRPGDSLRIGRGGRREVVGLAVAPDNVAFPLSPTARIFLGREGLAARFGADPDAFPVNSALLWAVDPSRADVLLSAARQNAGQVRGLRFVTREGVRSLVERTAGIVVALLVAFGVVAAGLAGILLGAGAQAEVRRRLPAIGVRRAIGLGPRQVVALHAAEGALVAAPAAAAGLGLGAVLAGGPTTDVLAALNQLPAPGGARLALLAGAWAAIVALVALAGALPAWGAARATPATLLRGGTDVAPRRRAGLGGSGLGWLGVRLATARRARHALVVAVLGTAAGVALLLLALASLLVALRDDPATLGKRYQLQVRLDESRLDEVRALPGVADAAPRFEVDAVSATALGSPLRLIAYPGDHTRLEAPALSRGRRVRAPDEAEVGAGLADAIGVDLGSVLAVQPVGERELRFRVVGIVRALQDEGRVAYVEPDRIAAAQGPLSGPIVVRLERPSDRDRVVGELRALGAEPVVEGGATGDDRGFLAVLAALLRLVAGSVALVVLYALLQSLTLTARERRGAVATLRAAGADGRALRRLLGGAAVAVAVPAAVLAVGLEGLLLSPLVQRIAAGYADLPLGATVPQAVAVAAGLLALALAAATLTARRLGRETIVAGLREAER